MTLVVDACLLYHAVETRKRGSSMVYIRNGGRYWDVSPCPDCSDKKGYQLSVRGLSRKICGSCGGIRMIGVDMTCHCVVAGRPEKDCSACNGTGISGWTSLTPPDIENKDAVLPK
jgi:hypothetical protein